MASQLEPANWPGRGLSPLNLLLCILIVAASAAAILETEETLAREHAIFFTVSEWSFGGLFLVEYLLRLWVAVENPRYRDPIAGRLRYLVSFPALLDLAAILPVFLMMGGGDTLLLRLVRLLRVLRLARLGHFSSALRLMGDALRSRKYELAISFCIAFLLLLLTSTLLYIVEGPVQPEAFGSIPRAMWWSVATLTTVGYGDVVPITALGRVLAGLTAVTGIGIIAMPTGILAAAFSDALQRKKPKGREG